MERSYFITSVTHQLSLAHHFIDKGLHYVDIESANSDDLSYGELITANSAYHNHITAIRASTPYRAPIVDFPPLYPCMSAIVESQNEFPALDEEGKIYVRPHFDDSGMPATEAMPPLPRLQPHLGPINDEGVPTGTHLPLYPGTEVLLASENGDPDRLFVLTSLPNADNLTPVTAKNCDENIFRTSAGHQVLMKDGKQHRILQVKTADGKSQLLMDATPNKELIKLDTLLGSMHIDAGNNLSLNAGGDLIERTDSFRSQIVSNNFCSETKQGNIHLQSGNDLVFDAKQDVNHQTGGNYQLLSEGDITLDVGQDANYISQDGDIHIEAKKGHISIHSKDEIKITGSGKGDIHIKNGNAGYIIDKQGVVTIYGDNVVFNCENGIKLDGKVNYLPYEAPPTQSKIPALATLKPAPTLSIQKDGKHHLVSDELILHFELPQGQTMSYLDGARYRLASILHPDPLFIDTEKDFSGVIKNAKAEIHNIDLQKPWVLELMGTKTKFALYMIAINRKPSKPSRWLYVNAGQYPITSTTDTKSGDILKTQTLHISILPLPINFNCRMYSKQNMKTMLKIFPSNLKWQGCAT